VGLKSFLSRRSKNRKSQASYRIATAIESLESRRLLAGGVSASLSGSLLTITGRPKNDNITISEPSEAIPAISVRPSPLKSAPDWHGAPGQFPERHAKKDEMSKSVPTSPSQL
jgi:hypothetical protein